MQIKKLNQVGDTIVEALISVAVLGLVIGAGYAIADRSLKTARASQERGEALKVGEAEVERIRSLTTSSAATIKASFTSSPFCLYPDGTPHAGACGVVSRGGYTYDISTRYSRLPFGAGPTAGSQDLFVITVRWDNVFGTGKDELKLYYKAHI